MPYLKWIAAAAGSLIVSTAQAQDRYIGEIILGGWNFCPQPYSVRANGQMFSISDHQALFSLYGTTYGGDGRTTFALPDLRGRAPIHAGRGPGLADRRLGAKGGAESVTMSEAQLPAHSHSATGTARGVATPGSSPNPAGNLFALTTSAPAYAAPTGSTVPMATDGVSVDVASTGGGQPVPTMDPYQVIQYCVVISGLYPSRS